MTKSILPRSFCRSYLVSSQLGCRRVIQNSLGFRIPLEFLPGPIGLRGHDASHRMCETIPHGGVRILATAQAIEPIRHVRKKDPHRQFPSPGEFCRQARGCLFAPTILEVRESRGSKGGAACRYNSRLLKNPGD
jgi:hypothetical protein